MIWTACSKYKASKYTVNPAYKNKPNVNKIMLIHIKYVNMF